MDPRERARLIAKYDPLVHRIVGIYAHAGFPSWVLDDLAQEGLVGLILAVDDFETSGFRNFGLYAKSRIEKYVKRAINRLIRERRERTRGKRRPEPSADPVLAALADELHRVIATLPEIEQRVVRTLFGLTNGEKSYATVAAIEGMTVSAVRAIWESAKRKMFERLRFER